mmetsp:Transcript_8859/g.26293  ORF Transcript_8859/g.26293 Transcript_8859/m.26293 type:complete len:331 (+) Transcript_8859:129-1121(+)
MIPRFERAVIVQFVAVFTLLSLSANTKFLNHNYGSGTAPTVQHASDHQWIPNTEELIDPDNIPAFMKDYFEWHKRQLERLHEEAKGAGEADPDGELKHENEHENEHNNNDDYNDDYNDGPKDESRAGSTVLRTRIVHFGLDVAEYKEGCRQIQALLLSTSALTSTPLESTSTLALASAASTVRTQRLLRELWTEAAKLLLQATEVQAVAASASSNGNGNGSNTTSLETLCDHVEHVITQTRRKKVPSVRNLATATVTATASSPAATARTGTEAEQDGNKINSNSSSTTTTTSHHALRSLDRLVGDYPHHQRDPPPIELFDLLWNELRTLG